MKKKAIYNSRNRTLTTFNEAGVPTTRKALGQEASGDNERIDTVNGKRFLITIGETASQSNRSDGSRRTELTESKSHRLEEAYQALGLTVEESRIAAGIEASDRTLAAWTRFLGSEAEAKIASTIRK